MPLKSKDAEKLLGMLWDVKIENLRLKEEAGGHAILPKEEHTLTKAISMLHCFITDIAPSFHSPLTTSPQDLYSDISYDGAIQVLNEEAEVQHIEFSCATTRDPGLQFESFNNPLSNSQVIYISHIDIGTVADRVEIFKRGDVVLEINGRSLARVSIDRARWLMRSAARTGKITLSIVTCDGRPVPYHVRRKDFKSSQSVQQHLDDIRSQPIRVADGRIHKIVDYEFHRRPSYTPSVGSRQSDHDSFINTVEMAAKISNRSSFRYIDKKLEGKNRQLVKAVLTKENGSLGLRLTGGKGSKFGDIGIYICAVEDGKPAQKNGSFKKGDELLMINGKSVVGYRVADVVKILKEAESSITIMVASKPNEEDLMSGLSSVSVESSNEIEVNKLLADRENLDQLKLPVVELLEAGPSLQKKKRMNSSSAYDLTLKPHEKKRERIRRASDQPPSTQLIELDELLPNSIATLSKQPITQWGRLSTGNVHASLPSKQTSKTIVFVKERGGPPLGFSLSGGKDSKLGDKGIFIRSIQENGIAGKDGRLEVGDEITVINEESMEGFTHKMAAEKIKTLKGVISLKVRSNPEYSHLISKLEKQSSVRGTPIKVTLERSNANEELGLIIAGLTDDRDEYGIFIKHIIPYSVADNCKLLHRADQIVSVNGTSLLETSIEDAMVLLSPNELPNLIVTLQVIRPKKVDALVKLLSYTNNEQYNTNWQGSFRMRERASVDRATVPNMSLSPLDKDILNLFTASEVELPDGPGQLQANLQEIALEFPSIANDLKDAQEKDDKSILSSMTPILSRPSFAKQYSTRSTPSGSPRVIEMKVKRESDLINNTNEYHETTFDTTNSDQSEKSDNFFPSFPPPDMPLPDIGRPPDMPLPDIGPPDVGPPDMPPPDMGPPDMPPPDMGPPPDMPPPDMPPPDMGPPDMPPPDMGPPDMPPPDMGPPDMPPPDMPPPDMPPPDMGPPDMPPPDLPPPDLPPVLTKDTPPLGFEALQLQIHKQQGKKGIGITLSGGSGLIDVYPTVKRLLLGSVGGKHGLKAGDRIGSIDNKNTIGLTSQEVMTILIEAPKIFDIVVFRDPNLTSESTPSLSSIYGQSVTYTESFSSLLSDEDSVNTGIKRPSLQLQLFQLPTQSSSPPLASLQLADLPALLSSLKSSEVTVDVSNDTNHLPQPTSPAPSPSSFRPPKPTTPPPSPPLPAETPPQPTTPPPSPTETPPQPTTPPPSPPLPTETPPQPTTPPPSPPLPTETPPQPTTPPPSPPLPTETPPQPTTPPPSPPLPTETPPQPMIPPPSPPLPYKPRPQSTTPKLSPQPGEPANNNSSLSKRDNAGPFTVEVIKGLFSLGLMVGQNEAGLIEVKSIGSRSPLKKDGTLQVHDLILSVNNKDVAGLSDKEVESLLKSLPKGVVTITAISPPKDVTGQGMLQATSNEDEGIIKVKLSRQANSPLGIIVEGGSDTPLQNIYISSLKPGSPAFNCGQFQRGDQIVMCGDDCLVGVTSVEAWDILTKVPLNIEFVLTRRKEIPSLLATPQGTAPTSQVSHPVSLVGHKRRISYSLHFSPITTSMENINTAGYEDDSTTNTTRSESPLMQTKFVEEHFTINLNRDDDQRLGLGVHGGMDDPQLSGIYIKTIDPKGVAGASGRLRRGDRLCSVNGQSLSGVTRHEALNLLKTAGNKVTLDVARQVTGHASQLGSKPPSLRGSAEHTPPACPSSGSPSPIMRGGLRGKRTSSIIGRIGLVQTQGVKVVELHKGPTGLGMLLKGSRSKDANVPITVREVLPGGVAYKSNKISIGDELLEANGVSFEGLEYIEAINIIKSLPQGTVRLVLLDKHFVIPAATDP